VYLRKELLGALRVAAKEVGCSASRDISTSARRAREREPIHTTDDSSTPGRGVRVTDPESRRHERADPWNWTVLTRGGGVVRVSQVALNASNLGSVLVANLVSSASNLRERGTLQGEDRNPHRKDDQQFRRNAQGGLLS